MKHAAMLFCLGLGLVYLTGCNLQGPANGTNGHANADSLDAEQMSPTSQPSTTASATIGTGTGEGTPVPSVAPSPTPSLIGDHILGSVYDISGKPLDGASVTVASLNPSYPYNATVSVTSGAYTVSDVPVGVQLRFTCSKPGYNSRSLVLAILPFGQANDRIDFGASMSAQGVAVNMADPSAPAYFLSPYVDIVSVTPVDDAFNVNPNQLSYMLTLSQPLDPTNQARFANALRVLPTVPAAVHSGTPADLHNLSLAKSALNVDTSFTTGGLYEITPESYFLDPSTGAHAAVTWDATGTVATLSFAAPLQTSNVNETRYQICLAATANAPIRSATGFQLGEDPTVTSGNLDSWPATSGTLIAKAFLNPNGAFLNPDGSILNPMGMAALSSITTKEQLYAATHLNSSDFNLSLDNTPPVLTGAAVSQVGGEDRILLTFSKPMACYGAGKGNAYFSPSFTNLSNYRFVFGNTTADLNGITQNGWVNVGQPTVQRFSAIGQSPNDGTLKTVTTFAASPTGLVVDIAPNDPKTVRIYTTGTANPQDLFGTYAHAMAVWVGNVQDPAGNAITTTSADASVKTTTF